MQKIIPNLWSNGNAREMAEFYASSFPDSRITGGSKYPESKEEGLEDFQLAMAGKDLTIELNLSGLDFVIINADDTFKSNSSNSFMVNFDPSQDENAKENLNALWEKLIDGGTALMQLDKYPFSEWYGWVQDKYGYSWQLILTDPDGEPRPVIIPSFMFGGQAQNRASEAMDFYVSVFENSSRGAAYPYGEQTGPASPEALMFADFNLCGQWFTANDSAVEQNFNFSEAVSFQVNCRDQTEIDELWSKLSSVPENEQCGWCKDKFGVSWQIVPENMGELMQKPGAFRTLMNQHKIVISEY